LKEKEEVHVIEYGNEEMLTDEARTNEEEMGDDTAMQ